MRTDINFFESVINDKSLKKLDFVKVMRNSLIFVVIVCALYYLSVFLLLSADKTMIRELDIELKGLATPDELKEIEVAKQQLSDLRIENEMFITYLKEFEASPTLYLADIEKISALQPENLIINSFSYADDKVNLSCSSPDQLTGAYFANLLRTSGLFEDIVYAGVSSSADGSSFNISFTIKREEPMTEGEEVEASDGENEQ